MCTYNGATNDGKYLRAQLDSILAQTYPITEIIIQDDCSTDDTMSILEDYAARYPIIHVFRNETQKGVNCNYFSAMARATSDYIMLSDQDDVWLPTKTEVQITTIGDHWLSAHHSCRFYTEDPPQMPTAVVQTPNLTVENFVMRFFLSGHTMMLTKDFVAFLLTKFSESDLLNWQLRTLYCDAIICGTAVLYQKIVFIPQYLVFYRRHATQITKKNDAKSLYGLDNTDKEGKRTQRFMRFLPLLRRPAKVSGGRYANICQDFAIKQDFVNSFSDVSREDTRLANTLIDLYTHKKIWRFRILYVYQRAKTELYIDKGIRGFARSVSHILKY